MSAAKTYLTDDQVQFLNAKHGRMGGSSEDDFSEEFVEDAIAMHERIRTAAPDLLAALEDCVAVMERELNGLTVIQPELQKAREAIHAATGATA